MYMCTQTGSHKGRRRPAIASPSPNKFLSGRVGRQQLPKGPDLVKNSPAAKSARLGKFQNSD